MISNLDNEEILDFLMTSDFEGDYKPEELKYLLVKWRYFYRLLNGKYELLNNEKNGESTKLNDEISSKNNKINFLLFENAELKNKIDLLSSRKLTWKERFKGKILKDDES